MNGAQGSARLLKNHGEFAATDRTHSGTHGRDAQDIDILGDSANPILASAMVDNLPPDDSSRLPDHVHNRSSCDALAAAALANYAQGTPSRNMEIDTINRTHDSFCEKEMRLEVLDLDKYIVIGYLFIFHEKYAPQEPF
jgi:hypothetical protein